jgi:hypothetical protein
MPSRFSLSRQSIRRLTPLRNNRAFRAKHGGILCNGATNNG